MGISMDSDQNTIVEISRSNDDQITKGPLSNSTTLPPQLQSNKGMRALVPDIVIWREVNKTREIEQLAISVHN